MVLLRHPSEELFPVPDEPSWFCVWDDKDLLGIKTVAQLPGQDCLMLGPRALKPEA